MKKFSLPVIFGFSLAGIGLVLIVIFSFSDAFNDGSWTLNAENADNYGGFIGGLIGPIFSLAGFLLLYETIVAQRLSFDRQQRLFEIQQFETKVFDLIHIHRDNVSQMVHRVPWDDNNYYEKARVFIEMRSQFSSLFKIVKAAIDKAVTISVDNKEKASINIAYLILFFGVSKATRPDLEHFLSKYGYDKPLTDPIISKIYLKKTKYNSKTVYYGGHQVRLGHYFRHLFQTVRFVDKATFLEPPQRYEYVKTLRAQLTQYELGIFFLNSLSIGDEWEKNKYITTYEMIKNLPKNFIEDINPKDYYRDFKYEWEK
ncbi:hypothetical protein GS399_16575 [Pedobacter sp. HMF7647]|uniref:Phage abortive infection protein n=1 Tax=Hufsiella arboris TaxID=2695275 RepID=A0A7K1YDW2_9SPHI|nr:putative phage abortive infection protein [Hufsiella arboris]MXV52590.1 hypothetical protein [Hufsiella arboris]